MSWEALSALASLASAVIVLVAALAAVLQLRHLRLANQLHSYLELSRVTQSREMIEARRYLQSQDFGDPEALRAATTPELDHRISTIAIHYQEVARLLNRGVLDQELFGAYFDMTPRVWKQLEPVAAVIRERAGSPLWIDIEYLVYRGEKRRLLQRYLNHYPDEFVRQAKLERFIPGVRRRDEPPPETPAPHLTSPG
jgi:uncharacterized protein (DUF488 family)